MQCVYTIGNALQELGYWLINTTLSGGKRTPTPNMMGSRLCNAHETLIWAVKKDEKAKFTFHYRTGKEMNREAVSESRLPSRREKAARQRMAFSVLQRPGAPERRKWRKSFIPRKTICAAAQDSQSLFKQGIWFLIAFGGTFTTGAAALDDGRRFIGIESNVICAGTDKSEQCSDKTARSKTLFMTKTAQNHASAND